MCGMTRRLVGAAHLSLVICLNVRLESLGTPHTQIFALHATKCSWGCMSDSLRLRGGCGAASIWEAIDNADSESDRMRLEDGDYDGFESLREFDMEELIKDCEGETTWEKLKNYVTALQDNYGEDEVDNIDVEEFGSV